MTRKIYLGADIGGTGIKFVLLDERREIRDEGELPTDPHSCRGSLQRLAEAVADSGQRPAAVGLACAGIVDPYAGTLGRSPNLPGWQECSLRADLAACFPDLPLYVANDVNAGLFGESRRGAGRDCRDLVMVALGTGVGGAVMIDGRLHLGSHAAAGEIGHMTLDPRGRICTCGAAGCLEAYAGSVALLQRARELAASLETGAAELQDLLAARGEGLNTRDLAELAAAGNPLAVGLFAEAGERLGQAVASLINVLDPERVILGGGVMQAGELLLAPCRDQAACRVLAEEARQVPIVQAELGPQAAAVGAACLALEPETGG